MELKTPSVYVIRFNPCHQRSHVVVDRTALLSRYSHDRAHICGGIKLLQTITTHNVSETSNAVVSVIEFHGQHASVESSVLAGHKLEQSYDTPSAIRLLWPVERGRVYCSKSAHNPVEILCTVSVLVFTAAVSCRRAIHDCLWLSLVTNKPCVWDRSTRCSRSSVIITYIQPTMCLGSLPYSCLWFDDATMSTYIESLTINIVM